MNENDKTTWSDVQSRIMPYLKARIDMSLAAERFGIKQADLRQIMTTYHLRHPSEILVSKEMNPSYPFCLYLVVDRPTMMDYVQRPNLNEWGVSEETAWNTAFKNLLQHPNSERVQPVPDSDGNNIALIYNTTDGYDATRIILPPVRTFLCGMLRVDRCLVGIPNRDFLIAFIYRKDVIEFVRAQIRKDFRTQDHPLTDLLFVIDKEGNISSLNS